MKSAQEHLARLVDLLVMVARAAMTDRITFLAASIAFYAVISVFPLLLLVLILGAMIGGEEFASAIVGLAEDLFTPETLDILEEGLLSEIGRSSAGVISFLILLWAGLKVFRGIDIAFTTVYGIGEDPTFLRTLVNAVIVMVSLGAAIAAIVLVQAAGAMIPISPAMGDMSVVLVFFALVVLFFPMYFVFPGVTQTPLEVLPGIVVAAAGWTLLGELFSVYATHAGTFALFGVIGGFLLLLMWFYFGAIVLLIGAILNAVLAGRFRDEDAMSVERSIVPGGDDLGERDG